VQPAISRYRGDTSQNRGGVIAGTEVVESIFYRIGFGFTRGNRTFGEGPGGGGGEGGRNHPRRAFEHSAEIMMIYLRRVILGISVKHERIGDAIQLHSVTIPRDALARDGNI